MQVLQVVVTFLTKKKNAKHEIEHGVGTMVFAYIRDIHVLYSRFNEYIAI